MTELKTATSQTFRRVLLAGASVVLLAACGGSDADASSEADDAAEAVSTAASEAGDAAEAAADDASEAMSDTAAAAEDMASDMAAEAEETAEEAEEAVETAAAEATDAATTDQAEATGTVHEVQMLNADPDNRRERMVFRPDLVVAKPGDTIRFVPTDPSHQSSSIDGMLPDGVEGWEGQINKAVEYVVPEPGVYGYKCVPHYAAGMVGLLIVEGEGMMDNVEEAKSVRQVGLASRRFDDIWERAEAEYLN